MNSIPAWVRKLWGVWDLRVLLLLSLTFQTILFVYGNRRKYISTTGIRIVIWLAYLTAGALATFSLGKLSNAQANSDSMTDPNSALRALWAPLLLLHLGGPDTITAYSLEDNQLWLRHLIAMCGQVIMAIYVILMSWRNSWFCILTIPVLVAGVIKYGERTWVLMVLGRNEVSHHAPPVEIAPDWDVYQSYPDGEALMQATNLLQYNQPFSNLEPNITSRFPPFYIDCFKCWDAFEVVMGLAFDFFYTKTALSYTKKGFILRAISFFCTVSMTVGFFLIVFIFMKEHCPIVDIALTGTLLVGALVLELYGVTVVLSSDWTMIWLMKHHEQDKLVIPLLFRKFPWLFSMHNKSRWSNSLGRFDLLSFCVKQHHNKPPAPSTAAAATAFFRPSRVLSLFPIIDKEKLDEYNHTTRLYHVPQHLKETITRFVWSINGPKYLTGEKALEDHNCLSQLQEFNKKRLDVRIIIWHVATELCEFHDHSNTSSSSSSAAEDHKHKKTSKLLSEHMMYLLVMCPFMLRITSWDSKFRHSCNVIKKHILGNDDELDEGGRKVNSPTFPDRCKDDPILGDGYKIAEFLKEKGDEKWEILTSVWVEMLCYAAKECDKDKHTQQLRRGGELLTVVWLLMAYLGRP